MDHILVVSMKIHSQSIAYEELIYWNAYMFSLAWVTAISDCKIH